MPAERTVRVGVNGYGVIGKRVAAAVAQQEDMLLGAVSDVVTDWRGHMVIRNGFRLYGAIEKHDSMRQSGLVSGVLDDLIGQVDVWWTARPNASRRRTSTCNAAVASSSSCKAARSIRRRATPPSPSATMPAHWAGTRLALCPVTPPRSFERSRHSSAPACFAAHAARFSEGRPTGVPLLEVVPADGATFETTKEGDRMWGLEDPAKITTFGSAAWSSCHLFRCTC